MKKEIEYTGQKFGRLTAIKFSHRNKKSKSYWLFKCDCGKEKAIRTDGVISGIVKSCGCLSRELTSKRFFKHGMIEDRFYKIWKGIKGRCLNKNNSSYKNYGDRGITICSEWIEFKNFYRDMNNSYKNHVKKFGEKNTSIDRENNEKGYYRKNCHFATIKEQNLNTRRNYIITYKGQSMKIDQWSKKLNINKKTLFSRLYVLKWSIKKAFSTQVRPRRKE